MRIAMAAVCIALGALAACTGHDESRDEAQGVSDPEGAPLDDGDAPVGTAVERWIYGSGTGVVSSEDEVGTAMEPRIFGCGGITPETRHAGPATSTRVEGVGSW